MSQLDTLSIFCCGTSFSRDNLDEAVAHTYQLTKGRKWINDGPGNLAHPILKSENILKKIDDPKYIKRLSGRDVFGEKSKGKRSLFANKIGVEDKYNHWFDTANKGALGGKGTADNVVNTIQWLWLQYWATQIDQAKAGRPPEPAFKTINLVGWSRGAVTCSMIAHAIAEAGFVKLIPMLSVNIFAFDPVPGAANDFGTKGKSFDKTGRVGATNTLPRIVNYYTSVLMENMDWKGALFKNTSQPTLEKSDRPFTGQHPGTFISEYPFPGSHADSVKYAKPDNPSGHVSLHLCHEFLLKNGTELTKPYQLTEKETLEQYAAIRIKWKDPKDASKKISPTKHRAKLVFNWMRDNNFFVNTHHLDIFKKQLPEVWDSMSGNKTLNEIQLKRLEVSYPKTFEALTISNHIDELSGAPA